MSPSGEKARHLAEHGREQLQHRLHHLGRSRPRKLVTFFVSHGQPMTDGTNSALGISFAVMASFSSFLRLLPIFLLEAISSRTASASRNRIRLGRFTLVQLEGKAGIADIYGSQFKSVPIQWIPPSATQRSVCRQYECQV